MPQSRDLEYRDRFESYNDHVWAFGGFDLTDDDPTAYAEYSIFQDSWSFDIMLDENGWYVMWTFKSNDIVYMMLSREEEYENRIMLFDMKKNEHILN